MLYVQRTVGISRVKHGSTVKGNPRERPHRRARARSTLIYSASTAWPGGSHLRGGAHVHERGWRPNSPRPLLPPKAASLWWSGMQERRYPGRRTGAGSSRSPRGRTQPPPSPAAGGARSRLPARPREPPLPACPARRRLSRVWGDWRERSQSRVQALPAGPASSPSPRGAFEKALRCAGLSSPRAGGSGQARREIPEPRGRGWFGAGARFRVPAAPPGAKGGRAGPSRARVPAAGAAPGPGPMGRAGARVTWAGRRAGSPVPPQRSRCSPAGVGVVSSLSRSRWSDNAKLSCSTCVTWCKSVPIDVCIFPPQGCPYPRARPGTTEGARAALPRASAAIASVTKSVTRGCA